MHALALSRWNLFALSLCLAALVAQAPQSQAEEAAPIPKPLRALLITGGCCHDYAAQKDVLKAGIEARAHVSVELLHSTDTSTAPPLAMLGNPAYGDGFDVIIHDECASDVSDVSVVEGVLAPHRAGKPGVNLHCAMHSYRTAENVNKPVEPGSKDSLWFDYIGIQSSGHGPQKPIAVTYTDKAHPAVLGMTDWETINEELYNNLAVRDSTSVLASGVQLPNRKPGYTEAAVVWTNLYGEKKARVFSTSLGHNTETVADARYLDLVTRGLLWACDKLDEHGAPLEGYGKP